MSAPSDCHQVRRRRRAKFLQPRHDRFVTSIHSFRQLQEGEETGDDDDEVGPGFSPDNSNGSIGSSSSSTNTQQQTQQPKGSKGANNDKPQKQSQGTTSKGATNGVTQKPSGSSSKTSTTKDLTQGGTKNAPPTNLTAIDMDEGEPVGGPGSANKPTSTAAPKKSSKASGSGKATIPPTNPTSTPNAESSGSDGEESRSKPPTTNQKGKSQHEPDDNNDEHNSDQTEAPSPSPHDSPHGDALTKYPKEHDDGTHTPEDENLKPPTDGEETKKSTAANMDEEKEEDVAELEVELKREEKEARRIGGAGLGLALIAMIFTAHQMSENPDGIYASCCRLIITLVGCAFKIVLMPCRSLLGGLGGNRHYGHMPVNTMDYGYREPYSNVEMS